MVSSIIKFDSEVFWIFLNHLHTIFGSAGDSMLFQMSKESSKKGMAKIAQSLPVDTFKDPAQVLEAFNIRMKKNGWGVFELVEADFDALKFKVEVRESPFEEIFNQDKGDCIDYFYRGVLVGFFEYLFGVQLMINQVITGDKSVIYHISKV